MLVHFFHDISLPLAFIAKKSFHHATQLYFLVQKVLKNEQFSKSATQKKIGSH